MFQIETEDAIYETEFLHVQVNITSRCNMRCDHCRGAYDAGSDLPLDDFERLMQFSNPHLSQSAGYLISGGEPLLHRRFKDLFTVLRTYVRTGTFVALTTNGTFLNEQLLDFLSSLEFPELRISISLDSIHPERHNAFRHSKNAYLNSIRAISLAAQHPKVKCIVRATIQPDQLDELDGMARLVSSLGADTLSVSSIIPVGRALDRPELYFDKLSKRELINRIGALRASYPKLLLDVNDPLAYVDTAHAPKCGEYGGCIAGIGTFSVEADGSMFPCPVLPNQLIMNIFGMTPDQMLEAYSSNQIVHALLERKLKGKCGGCELRFACGGCRARAEGILGDYLAEDPDCWR